jgi:hypothetical protein
MTITYEEMKKQIDQILKEILELVELKRAGQWPIPNQAPKIEPMTKKQEEPQLTTSSPEPIAKQTEEDTMIVKLESNEQALDNSQSQQSSDNVAEDKAFNQDHYQ